MAMLEPSVKYRGQLVKSGAISYLYRSGLYPTISIQLHYHDEDDPIITAECNLVDLSDEQVRPLFRKADGDLDTLLKLLDKSYGEMAPGFDEEEIEYVEPAFRNLKWNSDRTLTIYTWGKKYHEHKPEKSKCNFNAEVIRGQRQGMNLKKVTGLNAEVQLSIKVAAGYIKFMEDIITKIEAEDLYTISINCTAGRHRSVSCAEILKREFYPKSTVIHMDLN